MTAKRASTWRSDAPRVVRTTKLVAASIGTSHLQHAQRVSGGRDVDEAGSGANTEAMSSHLVCPVGLRATRAVHLAC